MSISKKYTREELLEILKNYYEENGKAVQSYFCNKNGLPHYQTYIKEFGSWNNAKRLIGIKEENLLTRYRMTKEEAIDKFKALVLELGHIPSLTELNNIKEFPSQFIIYKEFENYNEFIKQCGINTIKEYGSKFKEEHLINEIKRFVYEFKRVPIPKDFEKLEGYPTRKTFTNHFESFNDIIVLAGFEPSYIPMKKRREIDKNTYTKEFLISEINRFIDEFGHVPTIEELDNNISYPLRDKYRKVFGTWNNALKEAGIKLNAVHQYDDSFLEEEFHRFFKENGRIPRIFEFNSSEYPSFWCYQNRFGSWNKAVVAYGYEPNDANRKFILEDGEICASSYEFDTSNWLKSKNVNYDRNIKYQTFIDNYKGKMDCDYVLDYNNEIWYVEVAGFLSEGNKLSEVEKMYYFKLKYKEKLLKRQNVNYLIIHVRHLKSKTFEEIFHFIK